MLSAVMVESEEGKMQSKGKWKVRVSLSQGQGLRAKSFQFQAHLIYMLVILDSVRNKGFELREGIASKAKCKDSP